MKNEIKIPSMGESISEVTIGQILAPTGTLVKADAEILELETDKVNQVLYAPQAGTVDLIVQSGDVVKIGQIIGSMNPSEGGDEKSVQKHDAQAELLKPVHESSKIDPLKPISFDTSSSSSLRYTKEAFITDLENENKAETRLSSSDRLVETSRIPKQGSERETRRPMSKIRKVIAKRLVEAQQTMAMLSTFNEVDLTEVIQLREKYKETFTKKYGCKLGFMSFFVKATLSALKVFPDLNSYIDGSDIVHREYYDIGVAIGTDKGVIVPIIRSCDQLSYAEIEQMIEIYAKKAREGTLSAKDLQGGGFTITNGGTYGSLLSTPILLSPQCGILGMHKIEKRPVVIDNQITIRSMMYIALSYDHRLIDGKEAVSFLVHIKQILEDPSRMLLGI